MSFFIGFADEIVKLSQWQGDEMHHSIPADNAPQGDPDSQEFYRPAAIRTEKIPPPKLKKQAEGSTAISGVDLGHGGSFYKSEFYRSLQRRSRPDKARHKGRKLHKTGSVAETAKQLASIARHDPGKLKSIAKAVTSGPGGSVAKGITYGAAGYSALKGLGYRDPETRKREPLEGAARGALKGGAVGALAALVFRYPALRRAVARHASTVRR
jgi:hypothetical protein